MVNVLHFNVMLVKVDNCLPTGVIIFFSSTNRKVMVVEVTSITFKKQVLVDRIAVSEHGFLLIYFIFHFCYLRVVLLIPFITVLVGSSSYKRSLQATVLADINLQRDLNSN